MCPPPWAIYAGDVNSSLVYAPSARCTTTFAFVYTSLLGSSVLQLLMLDRA